MVQAQAVSGWHPPIPVRAGPEMAALHPFHFNCQWTGKVHAGGMGPGSPEMDAVGQANFTPIMDGAWLVGEFAQDQFVSGQPVITWQAHYVVGWDSRAGTYHVTYVDNSGNASLMHGRIDGARFIIETPPADAVQLRMAWEVAAPGQVTWRNECSIAGGPWFLIEEYLCTPLPDHERILAQETNTAKRDCDTWS